MLTLNQMDERFTIKTYEDACKALDISTNFPAMDMEITYPMTLSPLINKLNNIRKLIIITQALNGDWRPDFSDPNQPKYYPWFYYDTKKDTQPNPIVVPFESSSNFGSPFLCRDIATATYLGQQFIDLFKSLFLD